MPIDPKALADELMGAHADRRADVVPPSAREGGIDLDTAYDVECELIRRRREAGYLTVGLKVGYANRAMWRVLGLETLVWASMYDDTVRYVTDAPTRLSIGGMTSPKIEPEIVFKLKHAPRAAGNDPAAVLESVEWLALGFEIIDCVYAGWKFQPADFVASSGLHAALVVGHPHRVQPEEIPQLAEQLGAFKVSLIKGDDVVAAGAGRNSLKNPALCLGELASAVARRPGAEPLRSGALVSSGTLSDAQFIASGETWRAVAEGLAVSDISVSIVN